MNVSIRPFESFRVGERAEYVRTVTDADVVEFARASVRFTAPVRIGDTVVTEAEVVAIVSGRTE